MAEDELRVVMTAAAREQGLAQRKSAPDGNYYGTVLKTKVGPTGKRLVLVMRDGVKNPDWWAIEFWQPVARDHHPRAKTKDDGHD